MVNHYSLIRLKLFDLSNCAETFSLDFIVDFDFFSNLKKGVNLVIDINVKGENK